MITTLTTTLYCLNSAKLSLCCILVEAAGNAINDVIHEEIQKIKNHTTELTTFNLEDSVKNLNPILWEFICRYTSSKRERIGRAHRDVEATYKKSPPVFHHMHNDIFHQSIM